MKKLVWLLMVVSAPALAQSRGGTDEWSLGFYAILGPGQYSFEGGATARNDGGAGVVLSVAHNLNNYFAIGVDASLSEFNYRATVVGSAGSFESHGDMEAGALRAHVTWNLLARPFTPFLSVNAGVMFLDTNIRSDPPANACWTYPWYGEVCGERAPTNSLTRLTYGVRPRAFAIVPACAGISDDFYESGKHFVSPITPVGNLPLEHITLSRLGELLLCQSTTQFGGATVVARK